MSASGDVVVETRGCFRSFPGVKARDELGLTLPRGRLPAPQGENGAGKSALLPELLARCESPAAAEFIRAEETIMHAALPRKSGPSC